MKTYHSFSSEETKTFAERLARRLVTRRRTSALVFALRGNLGAGKTTFVQGFFKGLGIKRRAQSPTFVIMRRYKARKSNIFHIDAYRMKKAADLNPLGLEDVVSEPKNIVLIEWAERAKTLLPKDAIWLDFTHGKAENERRIAMRTKKKK